MTPAEDASRLGTLFDAFRRGNAALAAGIPGSGLGLSIVHEVVDQVGGYVDVQSQPEEGSTFTLAFPARKADEPIPPQKYNNLKPDE